MSRSGGESGGEGSEDAHDSDDFAWRLIDVLTQYPQSIQTFRRREFGKVLYSSDSTEVRRIKN